MKTAMVVSVAVIAQAVANTLLSKGMKIIASMPSFSGGVFSCHAGIRPKKPLHLGRDRSIDRFFRLLSFRRFMVRLKLRRSHNRDGIHPRCFHR